MELHWLSFLVFGLLASISAQSIYDDRRINPYDIIQQQGGLEIENYEQYLPVQKIGRSSGGEQRAILDEEKYRKLRKEEVDSRKIKIVIKKLSAMVPPLIRLLKKKIDEEDD